jgi:flagellar hook-associated protein 1 FlgK
MASMFNSLNIGYSGLAAAQVGINVTGQNITNAESEGYTRQRVVQSAQTPISGTVGNGVEITDTKRVFDNFVFDNYTEVSADKEYADFSQRTLEELSTYFPEVDGVGVKADLAEYYNMWQTFADNPDNDAIKTALAQQTTTLTEHINQTQDKVKGLQDDLNNQLEADVNQVNDLAKQLAALNKSIDVAESGGDTANDLRDRRNVIERNLSKLIGSDVSQSELTSDIGIDSNSNTRTGSYTLSVNGFNIVDGGTYHPLHIGNEQNSSGFYEVSYERQDGTLIPIEESITSGKIGAIFDLRGGSIDTTTGQPTDGIIQKTSAQLNAFAKGLVESTNNIYAASSSSKKDSNSLNLSGDTALASSNLNINEGSFDIVIYDNDGKEVSRRAIEINTSTSMTGEDNSIESQIKDKTIDDNGDGNADNDIDDFIIFNYSRAEDGTLKVEMQLTPETESIGYTFSVQDTLTDSAYASGTNFAGAIGLGRYLDGDDASNIKLATEYENNPTKIESGSSGASGDSDVALSMVQQQFENYDFDVGQETYNTTVYGMFDVTSTYVGISTNNAITQNDTITAQFNATELEYYSTSKVSVDEEMTNLIKYQNSYGAAAKIITTIDQMMQTLLGIKR